MIDFSIVIETVTVRWDHDHGPLAEAVAPTLAALERQTFPRQRFEVLLVLDPEVEPRVVEELRERYPSVRLVPGVRPNYFAEKNAGAAASTGAMVVFLDADCVPDPAWLESLAALMKDGADMATGKTRYEGASFAAKTFSVPDFAQVLEEEGAATGIMLNNVAFRREVILEHPLDERIPRNGGCYLLYHQLASQGRRMVYGEKAVVSHGVDVEGLGFVRKHFDRGYDSVIVYDCDDTAVLRGTRYYRRLGPLALAALAVRRIGSDWKRLARARRQVGISAASVPYYAAVMTVTRTIEVFGAFAAYARAKRR